MKKTISKFFVIAMSGRSPHAKKRKICDIQSTSTTETQSEPSSPSAKTSCPIQHNPGPSLTLSPISPTKKGIPIEPRLFIEKTNKVVFKCYSSLKIDAGGELTSGKITEILNNWVDWYKGELHMEGICYTIFLLTWVNFEYNIEHKQYEGFFEGVYEFNLNDIIFPKLDKWSYTIQEVIPFRNSQIDVIFNIELKVSQQQAQQLHTGLTRSMSLTKLISIMETVYNPNVSWKFKYPDILVINQKK
uniref:Matrix protein n=1 Tax=Xiangshan rhabdo-like virus 5 TaxID=2886228 RepID=A0A8K1YQQ6_9RHAB|nr:MAG: hypothetical protein [Xiangshan rhabdo-like virus 5]